MTDLNRHDWDDAILPFQLDSADIRGRVARLDKVLDNVLAQHDYPAVVENLVAEMAILTALIGQTVKLRWKLSLQVRGSGAVRLIATDYYAPQQDGDVGQIRAYASYDKEKLDLTGAGFEQIGKGYFAILIDQGQGTKPYQGITPISGGSLSECAETYFAQSEQLPTRFSLAHGRSLEAGGVQSWRAGGVMLQHMPKASPLIARDAATGEEGTLQNTDLLDGDDHENWNRVNILLDTVEELELVGPSVSQHDLLLRLFHEENPKAQELQRVRFGCTCSEKRVRDSLSIYSAKDIKHMINDEGKVTADCQFCGAHYVLEPTSVGMDALEKDGTS